jgi:hypothetical protein
MHAVTYGGARTPATALVENTRVKPRKSVFARFMHGLKQSRLEEARRVIERHSHLLGPDRFWGEGIASEGQNDETLSDRT